MYPNQRKQAESNSTIDFIQGNDIMTLKYNLHLGLKWPSTKHGKEITMAALILNSLEIRRFRAFHHLRIEKLGRVNLIVGKNNVGKSCLLEALQLYANRAHPTFIWQILGAHDEDTRSALASPDYDVEEVLPMVKYLFHGRRDITGPVEPIEIGPINSLEEKLLLSIEFYTSKTDEEGRRTFHLLQPTLFEEYTPPVENSIPRFFIQLGKNHNVVYPLDLRGSARLLRSGLKEINSVFTAANGLDKRKAAELWDKIALTDLQKEVLAVLRIVAPGLQDISVIGDPNSKRQRFTIVKVTGISDPLPIRSLGDGMQRLLGIALALVNAKDGLLLIDEIENGLHYSTQPDLWRLIFLLARELNVQVFATTHSWDCVTSFQQAAQENEQEEGMLIRLEHKNGNVSTTMFDEQKLAIAAHEQIEVR
jgi:ABC-type cobalamin/Fe3+-siderophores transport system ATPase subunit